MATEPLDCVEIDPAADPSAVIIWLHGLGADGHDFEPIVPELDLPRTLPLRFVFPHAPMRPVTINFGMVMRAWYDILEMDVSRRIDMENFLESCARVRELIQRERNFGMPSDRIIVAGFSQGGAVALHTALRYPHPLGGILALSTYLPAPERLPEEAARVNRRIPILMGHGSFDPLIPMQLAAATREALVDLNYDVEWREYPMQHEVCPEEIRHIRRWLLETLG